MDSAFLTKIISIDELWRFFNLSSSLFCIAGKDGYYKHINPAFTHLLGFDEEELVSRPYEDFIHPDDRELTERKLTELKNGNPVAYYKNRWLMAGGAYKCFSWTAFLPNGDDIYAIGQDSTEMIILQDQLMEQRIQEERSVMQAVLNGQEIEKNEIGKELHDNINQMLTTVGLYHEMALKKDEVDKDLIKKGTKILVSAIEEIRKLSNSLVAPTVDELSLFEIINDLVNTIMEGKQIKIVFHSNAENEFLSGKIKLTIFRIVQEQLNNVLKHAHAENVSINILNEPANIKLTIQDDGRGFDTSKKKKGIGLKNIISRTKLFNGNVKITSAPGKGCILFVNIPIVEIHNLAV